MKHLHAPVLAVLLTQAAAVAQTQAWSTNDEVPNWLIGLTYDVAQHRLLGIEYWPMRTWVFDAGRWRRLQPDGLAAQSQSLHNAELLGYDNAQGLPILTRSGSSYFDPPRTFLGGYGGWVQAMPYSSPHLSNGGVACDPVSGHLLAFGGMDATYNPSDAMFAWNGGSWSAVNPAIRPSPRSAHGMALDPVRGRVVLFGGSDGVQALADTWEWDGASWTQRAPASAPSARMTAMAWDAARQRIVLVGGYDTNYQVRQDTYEWDGTGWTPSGMLPEPMTVMACSDDATVVIGTGEGRLLRRAGTGWNVLFTNSRPDLYGAAMAFDPTRGEVLALQAAVTGSTLAWNGSWQTRRPNGTTSGSILARGASGLAPLGTDMILFGGTDSSYAPLLAMFDETWRWNGQSWSQLHPAHAPSARYGPAMASTGSSILLFGGRDPVGLVDDTWTFDGVDWTQLQPVHAPSPRTGAALAWDASRQRAVLFGGTGQGAGFDDTWEWDGQDWTAFATLALPQAGECGIAATPTGILLAADYLWQWTGSDWVNVGDLPVWAYASELAWDGARQRLVFAPIRGDVYVLGPTPPVVAATTQTCGNPTGMHLLGQPGIGQTPDVHLDAAAGSIVFTVFGLQQQATSWGPGCTQLVRADAVLVGSTDQFGHLDIPFAIPAALGLRGVQIHVQSVVLDGGPVFGGSISGALHLTIGD